MWRAHFVFAAFVLIAQAAPPPKKAPPRAHAAPAHAAPVPPSGVDGRVGRGVGVGSGNEVGVGGGVGGLAGGVVVGGRLVIHVGPHKTGTSSTQYFLVQNVAWLNKTYGIQVSRKGPESAKCGQASQPS